MPTFEEEMAKWGEQFLTPRPQSFEEDAQIIQENNRVTEETTTLEGFPFDSAAVVTLRRRGGVVVRPPCVEISLRCDLAHSHKVRCGFSPIQIGADYFEEIEITACNKFDTFAGVGSPVSENKRYLRFDIAVDGCDPGEGGRGCASTGSYTYGQNYGDRIACTLGEDFTEDGGLTLICPSFDTPADCTTGTPIDHCGDVGDPADLTIAAMTGTESVSSEYTDTMVGEDAVDALPAYPGTFSTSGVSCAAGSGFGGPESNRLSYDYTKMQYQFVTSVPPGCYLKIYWNETFLPDSDPSSPVTNPMTWVYDPGPGCIVDDFLYSDVFEILPGILDEGSYIITDIRWSYSAGYDPGPTIPEGFDLFASAGPNCTP